jgi:hypothetical protein
VREEWRQRADKVWRDPVWSKVIATCITATVSAVVVLAVATARGCFSHQNDEGTLEARPAAPVEPTTSVASLPKKESPPEAKTKLPGESKRDPETSSSGGHEPQTGVTGRLFVDCRLGTMPARIPHSGRVYALVPLENGGGGLAEYFGEPGGDWSFGKSPQWAYRCEVINYAHGVLIDVTFDIRLTLTKPERVPDQPNAFKQGEVTLARGWKIVIPKIDPGPREPFVFYVHNCCLDRFVHARIPSVGTGTFGEQTVELEIQQSATNMVQPLYPVSMFTKE